MEIEKQGQKRKPDAQGGQPKRHRAEDFEPTVEEVAELSRLNALLSEYVKQREGRVDDFGWQFVHDRLLEPYASQAPTDPNIVDQPAIEGPTPHFEPLRKYVDRVVPEDFEEFVYKQEGSGVYYPVDESYQGEVFEFTDEELENLKKGEGPVIFAPLVAGSLLAGARNDTVNVPLSLVFHFIDVGQGSGTLVKCPHGETILIDLGTSKAQFTDKTKTKTRAKDEEGEVVTKLVEFVRLHASHIDYLVISHCDQDHISLVNKLKDGVTIGTVLLGGTLSDYKSTHFTDTFVEYLIKREKARLALLGGTTTLTAPDRNEMIKRSLLNGGKAYSESPALAAGSRKIQAKDVDIWIVSANASPVDKDTLVKALEVPEDDSVAGTAPNTSSIVVCFNYKGKQVVISADATFSTDYEILEGPWKGQLKSYAVSGGHHGSRQSLSPVMLREFDPEWVHFSADMKDRFGHPEWALVQRVAANCPRIFERPAWGPHGVVVGKAVHFDLATVKAIDDDIQHLFTMKKKLTEGFPSLEIEYRHALVAVAMEFFERRNEELRKQRLSPPPIATQPAIDAEVLPEDAAETTEPADWWTSVIIEVELWLASSSRGLSGEHFLAAMTADALPNAHYWGERFRDIEVEYQRINALTEDDFGNARWHWFTTQANLFTTLEAANAGVYWRLEIDSNGKAHTDRT